MLLKALFWMLRAGAALHRRIAMRLATRLHIASLAKVGRGSRFQAGVRFDRPDCVQIGADCIVWRGTHAPAEGQHPALLIGDRVQINQGVLLDMTGGLRLADDVLISEEAVLYTHDHGLDPHATPQPMSKDVGAGVWIGMRAVILPQCRQIGAMAVIGAGAVVTRDVPAGAIMAGNPARQIGQRARCEVAA